MARAIRGHSLGAMMAIALLAALLLLVGAVFAVQQVATTGDSVERSGVSADRTGGSNLTRDPYVERHAEMVAAYRERAAAHSASANRARGAGIASDPYVERHADVIARHNQDSIR